MLSISRNIFSAVLEVENRCSLDEMWELLDNHPIFPSEGFRNEIKSDLTDFFDAKIEQIVNFENRKKGKQLIFFLFMR